MPPALRHVLHVSTRNDCGSMSVVDGSKLDQGTLQDEISPRR